MLAPPAPLLNPSMITSQKSLIITWQILYRLGWGGGGGDVNVTVYVTNNLCQYYGFP